MNAFAPTCHHCGTPLVNLELNTNGFPKYKKCSCLTQRKANSGSFKKGNVAWNNGLKGIHLSPSSEFKKGKLVGSDHPSWKGGEQLNANDCVYVSVGANKRVRRPVKIYQDEYGKIPKGWILYHIDKNKHNDDLDNLIAIPRAILIMINADRINANYQELKSAVKEFLIKNNNENTKT